MTLHVQYVTMASMILSGFYVGIALDTFRRFSVIWKKNKFFLYIMEVFFWLSHTALLFLVLFLVNAGELRFYIILACLLGFSAYQALVANVYKRMLESLIRGTLSLYRFLKKIFFILIITPLKILIRGFIVLITFIGTVVLSILLFLFNVLFTPLKWIFLLLYHFMPDSIKKYLHNFQKLCSRITNNLVRWFKAFTYKGRK